MQIKNQSQTNIQPQGRDAAIQITGEGKAKNRESLPGYVCKRCGGVAPVGIGYAAGSWARDETRTACDCGYSVVPSARFRIEASKRNPAELSGNECDNLHDYAVTEDRAKARDLARAYWRAGYWVEVFDADNGELRAGPIDPDEALPSYIV